MQISKIHSFNIHPKILFKGNKDYYKPLITECDSFVRMPEIEESCENFNLDNAVEKSYNNLEKSMGILQPHDIELMAERIRKQLGCGAELSDIFQAMEIITQYSGLRSLKSIQEQFKPFGIRQISNLNSLYLNKNDNQKLPITLTNVFSYLAKRNLNYTMDFNTNSCMKYNKALILDSKLLEILKNENEISRGKYFRKEIQGEKIYPFYIKNFENGYNFLNQEKGLEEFTLEVLKKAAALKNNKSLKENVEYILNADNIRDIEKMGIEPIVIDFEYKDGDDFLSPQERIAENVNPIIISKENLKIFFEEISKDNEFEPEILQKYYIDFFNKMMTVITPKQYAEHLKNIHNNLISYLDEHNKSFENTYFLVPSMNKSFTLAYYQYQKINNIPPDKFIYNNGTHNMLRYDGTLSKLPDNSTLVIVDDCVISGASMLHEVFGYEDFAESSVINKKNIGIVFAPIVATKNGINKIRSVINKNLRSDTDKIFTCKILPQWFDESDLIKKLYKSVVPVNTGSLSSLILPYMGPDNNCSTFVPLYEEFLYSHSAQKSTLDGID